MPPVHEGWEGGSRQTSPEASHARWRLFVFSAIRASGGEGVILPCRASLLPQTAQTATACLQPSGGKWREAPGVRGGPFKHPWAFTVPGQARRRHRRWPSSLAASLRGCGLLTQNQTDQLTDAATRRGSGTFHILIHLHVCLPDLADMVNDKCSLLVAHAHAHHVHAAAFPKEPILVRQSRRLHHCKPVHRLTCNNYRNRTWK